jgi:1-acyl-sn-glycerol-3-phosphate acyltransferase
MPTDDSRPAALTGWLAYWRAMQRWHRYEVSGLEHLRGPTAKLIVGYHGRPIAHDLCMLTVRLYDELGYLPHGVAHSAFEHGPGGKILRDLGFVAGDGPGLAAAVQRGEHVLVAPGGTQEGCRTWRDRYTLDWGHRSGYVRLALRYRLPVVPVAAWGSDDAYLGLNNGAAWGKRLHLPAKLPAWLGIGPLGLWPLSPPFPVRIHQRVGKPLDLWQTTQSAGNDVDRERLAHQQVQAAVQALLLDLRRQYGTTT